MKYRIMIEARFETEELLPEGVRFGEKAIEEFVAQIEKHAPNGPSSAQFLKMSLEKVEE